MRKPIALLAGLTIVLLLAISIFSGQKADLDWTYSYAIELTQEGIRTFNDAPKRTGAPMDYLPSLYLALRAIMIPTYLFRQGTVNSLCEWGSSWTIGGCTDIIDSAYLKLFFTLSILFLSGIVAKRIKKSSSDSKRAKNKRAAIISLCFLLTPTIFYSVYLFNGYDAIGLLATVSGLLLYSREGKNREGKTKGICYEIISILLIVTGISTKLLPIPLFIGGVIAASKTAKAGFRLISYSFLGLAAQLALIISVGGNPLRILIYKSQDPISLNAINIYQALTISGAIFLFTYFSNLNSIKTGLSKNAWPTRLALGSYISLAGYTLLFSGVIWHPQWLILYGFSATSYLLVSSGTATKTSRLFAPTIIIAFQAICFAISTQLWHQNADVSISLQHSPLSLYLPLQNEMIKKSVPLAWKFFLWSSWGFLAWATLDIKNLLNTLSNTKYSGDPILKELFAFSVTTSFIFSLTWIIIFGANYHINVAACSQAKYFEKSGTIYSCNSSNRKLPQAENFRTIQPNNIEVHPNTTNTYPTNLDPLILENPYYIFNEKEKITFGLNPEVIGKALLVGLRIGNHFNKSKGQLEVCPILEHTKLTRSESQSNSFSPKTCSYLNLIDTKDNEVNFIALDPQSTTELMQIKYISNPTNKSPFPVLWVGNSKGKAIKLYTQSR